MIATDVTSQRGGAMVGTYLVAFFAMGFSALAAAVLIGLVRHFDDPARH
jgi:hypothetical protein